MEYESNLFEEEEPDRPLGLRAELSRVLKGDDLLESSIEDAWDWYIQWMNTPRDNDSEEFTPVVNPAEQE